MNIIKRSGQEVPFDREKIAEAVRKANRTVEEGERLTEDQIERITDYVTAT